MVTSFDLEIFFFFFFCQVRRLHNTARDERTGLVTTIVGKQMSPSFLMDLKSFLEAGKQKIPEKLIELARLVTAYQNEDEKQGPKLPSKEPANDW